MKTKHEEGLVCLGVTQHVGVGAYYGHCVA